MADKKDTPAAEPQSQVAPQAGIQVVTQFIRDLSFENLNAPESLVGNWGAPEPHVQVFLRHKKVQEDTYDCTVNFKIETKKKDDDKTFFIVELSYGALIVLRNIPEENHQAAVLVEVPKLLFPFAREIVADVTAKGGYPPLYLAPISFEAIYVNEMKRQQQEKEKQTANGKS